MTREYVAFQGEKITIEWYYKENGRSPAQEYFESLMTLQKDKLAYAFILLDRAGFIIDSKKFRFEGDGIFAFKVQQERFLCFFATGARIVLTNAYRKKAQKILQKRRILP